MPQWYFFAGFISLAIFIFTLLGCVHLCKKRKSSGSEESSSSLGSSSLSVTPKTFGEAVDVTIPIHSATSSPQNPAELPSEKFGCTTPVQKPYEYSQLHHDGTSSKICDPHLTPKTPQTSISSNPHQLTPTPSQSPDMFQESYSQSPSRNSHRLPPQVSSSFDTPIFQKPRGSVRPPAYADL